MKQKIVFFGSGWFVVPVVDRLIPHGLDLVITNDRNPDSPLLKFCKEQNINAIIASSASDLTNNKSQITNHDVAILASFGVFIPDEIINLFPKGIINIHPSLLPKYKGPSPVQYQILNGETTVGVTLIKLDDQIDHGPILSQQPYQTQGNETSEDLLSILFEIGADLVVEQIERLERGEKLTATPQDHTQESWSYKIEKEDGKIDPYSLLTTHYPLANMIRAYYPWPSVWFKYTPNVIPDSAFDATQALSEQKRTERDPGSSSNESTILKQSKLSNKIIKLLPESRIQVEGKKPMSYKDFINGFGEEGKELLQKLRFI